VNQYAASHSERLDEAYEVLGRKYAEMDRQCDAQQRFNSSHLATAFNCVNQGCRTSAATSLPRGDQWPLQVKNSEW